VIAGPWYSPMMFNEPGTGFLVEGELYEVAWESFVKLDALESIGQPGNLRLPICVTPRDGDGPTMALAYFKDRSLASPIHTAYLTDYQDCRFVPPDRRPAQEAGGPRLRDDAAWYRAADSIIRKHGANEALKRACARSGALSREGRTEAARFWKDIAEIIGLFERRGAEPAVPKARPKPTAPDAEWVHEYGRQLNQLYELTDSCPSDIDELIRKISDQAAD
jgi:gamma-glutamylaminecyclotransferase